VTLKEVSQAGQSNSLDPGLGLILSWRSQLGQFISTLIIFCDSTKFDEHALQVILIGRSSVPVTNTVLQLGHGNDSEINDSVVGW
tara:strand:- start:1048 stop:1302 length:255 start_codon:yes stop_codon:yes gene_type:complete